MKKQPSIQELEQLGLILASVNDILKTTYKQATRLFPKSLWGMKELDFCCRNLELLRDHLESYAFKFYGVDTIDVFCPLMSKRGRLMFPVCDEEGDEDHA